jgi:hypothetical protein
MAIASIVAAIVAALSGIRLGGHPRLAYWLRWDPAPARIALTIVSAVCGAVGVATAIVAYHFGLTPVSSRAGGDWLNGLTCGVAAAVVLRLDAVSGGLSPLAPARLIFQQILRLLESWLDDGTARTIPRRIGDLTPLQLMRVSSQLCWKWYLPMLERIAQAAHVLWLREVHLVALDPGDPLDLDRLEDSRLAQEILRYYIVWLITRNEDATVDIPPDPAPH